MKAYYTANSQTSKSAMYVKTAQGQAGGLPLGLDPYTQELVVATGADDLDVGNLGVKIVENTAKSRRFTRGQ